MHFHLPKPLHGWREFAGEVGIIVVGVLIALGAEQVVERVHERNVARDADNAIRTEIGADLGALANRIRTEPCIAAKLTSLNAYAVRASTESISDPPRWVGRPQLWNMETSRWDAASQAGRAALLPLDEQSEYDDIYGSLKQIGDAEADEQRAWATLRSFEGVPHLGEAALIQMRSALATARYDDWRIKLAFKQSEVDARSHGIALNADARYPGSKSACIPLSTARQQALAMLGAGAMEP